jgi:hypothetical protein
MSYNGDLLERRIASMESFMELRDGATILATARRLGLRWFLVDPGDHMAWPALISQRPAFELGGYRLYRF